MRFYNKRYYKRRSEELAEIPEQYICHRGDKICEIKGEPTDE